MAENPVRVPPDSPDIHPVQQHFKARGSQVRREVVVRAYEVYVHLYGHQDAMMRGGCRGGFSVGELVAFLYARSFPQAEWQMRFDEALKGMHL